MVSGQNGRNQSIKQRGGDEAVTDASMVSGQDGQNQKPMWTASCRASTGLNGVRPDGRNQHHQPVGVFQTSDAAKVSGQDGRNQVLAARPGRSGSSGFNGVRPGRPE